MANNIQVKSKAEVEMLKVLDVKENELLYVRIWNETHTANVVVNIGQKNYDALTKLLQPRETSTQLNILPPEQKTQLDLGLKPKP